MDILVTGGTGFVGSYVCTELAGRGHDVTALSRNPDPSAVPDSVTVVSGNVREYESILEHLDGRDVVVNLVALEPMFKPRGGDDMHFRVHLDGTRNVVNAAEEQEVGSIVQMSALGADPDGPTAYIRAKGQAEQVVQDSSLDWTIFRPSVIFGDGAGFIDFTKLLTTPYLTGLPGGGKTRFQPIWIGDLAPMLADAVENDSHRGAIYDIGGPEVLTLADVTKLVYRAEGRSVAILSVPMSLSRLGLALADPVPFVPFGADQFRSLQFDNTTAENDLGAFGRSVDELRTFADYLKEG